ncbi:MAG: Sulfate transport system permease protein CysT [bacterium]|nr:Sulfate transport system permease protein CysT [bacterium]
MDPVALQLTLRLALGTTVILTVCGLPLAWWLATTRWPGRFLVESLLALPLLLPPTVLGFYLLTAFSPDTLAGSWYTQITGQRLPFSFAGILLASVIFNIPFAMRPFIAALARIDQRLLEASWTLGESPGMTLRRVVLPLAWPGILTGMVLTFAHTIGEFGVVLMVGGNIPGVTRTLSIAIYDDVQALNYAAAATTSLWLVAFAFLVLSAVHLLEGRDRVRV